MIDFIAGLVVKRWVIQWELVTGIPIHEDASRPSDTPRNHRLTAFQGPIVWRLQFALLATQSTGAWIPGPVCRCWHDVHDQSPGGIKQAQISNWTARERPPVGLCSPGSSMCKKIWSRRKFVFRGRKSKYLPFHLPLSCRKRKAYSRVKSPRLNRMIGTPD